MYKFDIKSTLEQPYLKKLFLVAGIVFALSLVFYTIAWFLVANYFNQAVLSYVNVFLERNFALRIESVETSGYPMSLRSEIKSPSFVNASRNFGWATSHISVQPLSLYGDKIQLSLNGPHKISFKDHLEIERGHTEILTQSCTADLSFKESVLNEILIRSKDFKANFILPKGSETFKSTKNKSNIAIDALAFKANNTTFIARNETQNAVYLHGQFKDIIPPAFLQKTLADKISFFEVKGMLSGVGQIQDFEQFAKKVHDGKEIHLNLQQLSLLWGDIQIIHGMGNLTLNRDGQLNGSIKLAINGYLNAINRLEDSGILGGELASSLRFAFGLINSGGALNKEDATSQIDLTLVNGEVFWGKVPLMRLPNLL